MKILRVFEKQNAEKNIWIPKLEGHRPLDIPRRKWEGNIKNDLKE
jgi:hypothetical protein